MIRGIDHVNIVVTDLEEAIAFFSLFGFRVTHEGDLSGPWISEITGLEEVRAHYAALQIPGSKISVELIAYDAPQSLPGEHIGAANAVGFRHLAFEVAGIEDEVQRLKASGVRFLSDVRVYPETGKKLVYLSGPDNILLELAEYPES